MTEEKHVLYLSELNFAYSLSPNCSEIEAPVVKLAETVMLALLTVCSSNSTQRHGFPSAGNISMH